VTESRPSAGGPLLEVTDLRISIPTEAGLIEAVRGVSFAMEAGDTLGVVGESGSGKTMLALATLGLVPKSAKVSGSIRLDGRELLSCTPAQWRSIRGARVSMVFQDPMTALNPMYKVGWQVAECVRLHERVSRPAGWRRAVDLLGDVGLPQPAQLAHRYPHELSGGMRQRVSLARALAATTASGQAEGRPGMLLMDEPFAALDAITRDVLQAELLRVWEATGTTVLFVTHDVREAIRLAERVVLLSSRPGTVVREWRVGDGPMALHEEITGRLRQVIASHAA
jgi:ABC-type glutathione transport system ATPase component